MRSQTCPPLLVLRIVPPHPCGMRRCALSYLSACGSTLSSMLHVFPLFHWLLFQGASQVQRLMINPTMHTGWRLHLPLHGNWIVKLFCKRPYHALFRRTASRNHLVCPPLFLQIVCKTSPRQSEGIKHRKRMKMSNKFVYCVHCKNPHEINVVRVLIGSYVAKYRTRFNKALQSLTGSNISWHVYPIFGDHSDLINSKHHRYWWAQISSENDKSWHNDADISRLRHRKMSKKSKIWQIFTKQRSVIMQIYAPVCEGDIANIMTGTGARGIAWMQAPLRVRYRASVRACTFTHVRWSRQKPSSMYDRHACKRVSLSYIYDQPTCLRIWWSRICGSD